MKSNYDPLNCALEIREQLASEKRKLAFFFGAGTSIAAGLPGIEELTKEVSSLLEEPFKSQYVRITKDFSDIKNVEILLNKIRMIREIMDNDEKEIFGLKGREAVKNLDSAICNAIYDIVNKEKGEDSRPHLTFAQWLRALHGHRDYPVELFTTNYDLLLEKAMEETGLPFFDGFVGAVSPFFIPESVEAEETSEHRSIYPPSSWTRLWKIHGSINWQICKDSKKSITRITRLSGNKPKQGEELVIFPSYEKYAESKKLPYIAFQDRLRRYLGSGETLMIVVGYSFSDQHINQIIFQGLRSNPKLAITAFIYGEQNGSLAKLKINDKFIEFAADYRNLTIYGPDKACIGGVCAPWAEPIQKPKEYESRPFWDNKNKQFTLGCFKAFAQFLELFIGFKSFNLIDNQKYEVPIITTQPSEVSNK